EGGGVDQGRLEPEARQVVADELAGAPVAVARHDEVRAAGQEREEERRRGAHARGEEHGALRALELAELALDGLPGRVAVAPVLLAREAPLLVGAQLLRVAEPEGRGLVDRGGDGLASLVLALAAVDAARRGTRASPG